MELKTYLFDKAFQRTYLSPRHQVKTKDGYVTYRLIEGDTELEMKKQGNRKVTEIRPYIASRMFNTDNVTIQKFIESRPDFGTKIKIYDPVSENEAKEAEAKNDLMIMNDVLDLDKVELVSLAWNIFGKDVATKQAIEDYSGIRLDVLAFAQKEPAKVKELMADKSKNVKFEIGIAFAQGIIEDKATEITWSGEKGNRIITIPRDTTAIEALADFYKEPEGREVRRLVQTKLKEIGAKNTKASEKKAEEPAK